MLRNAVRKIRFNGNRIFQRLEHSHNSPKIEKVEDISKIMKELEVINKNMNTMHNDIKVINKELQSVDFSTTMILSINVGSITAALIVSLL